MLRAAKLVFILAVLAAPACNSATQDDGANGVANVTDIEQLPADESAQTSSEELANGASEPDVEDLGNQH